MFANVFVNVIAGPYSLSDEAHLPARTENDDNNFSHSSDAIWMSSTKKKRRIKMNKHKIKKRNKLRRRSNK